MARKKIELFIDINTDKEFEHAIERYRDKFICAEIFSAFVGYCRVLDKDFTKLKVIWSDDGEVVLLRVLADEVEAVSRLRDQSEPFYMFIVNKKVTGVLRGVNAVKFEQVVKKELAYFREEKQGINTGRPKYEIDEATPDEMEWINATEAKKDEKQQTFLARHTARQAVRKRHRAELMATHLNDIDFVLYWPHATHAHPELYERWNENNLIMVGREEFSFTEEQAKDVLYSGDAPINEASMHALLSGHALAICLRSLDPVDIVSLIRKILYEDHITHNDSEERKSQTFLVTAFEHYKTFSPTRQQIVQQRNVDRLKRIEEAHERRSRHLAEMQRLAHQKRDDAIQAKKAAREQLKMELLKSGKLAELHKLEAEQVDDEDVDIEIPEELSEASEEESEVEDDPDEYFPPAGLPIPGFYSPPNNIAKANGLAILFPNIVKGYVTPTEEFFPLHVLVMINMLKRHKAIDHMAPFKYGILHMGIFKADAPNDAVHVAYSVKQFDSMDIDLHTIDKYKLCFMVSTKIDVPLLELMELNPIHVSRDTIAGEDECAALFSVDYGDNYPEFEDFEGGESSKEEEKN